MLSIESIGALPVFSSFSAFFVGNERTNERMSRFSAAILFQVNILLHFIQTTFAAFHHQLTFLFSLRLVGNPNVLALVALLVVSLLGPTKSATKSIISAFGSHFSFHIRYHSIGRSWSLCWATLAHRSDRALVRSNLAASQLTWSSTEFFFHF